jgi:glycosyltransferase involved in cell wall biosynthesis
MGSRSFVVCAKSSEMFSPNSRRALKISVALATYNGERFLGEQLRSLAEQTRLPDELVVCDDGSGDRTVEVLERFAADAPFPVRVHRNERRLRFEENFLRAASLCDGDAVAFCDQDDVWLSDKLRICEGALDHGTTVVVHASELVDESLRPLGRRWPAFADRFEATSDRGDPWPELPGFVLVFRRDLLELPMHSRPRSRASAAPMSHDEWVYFLGRALGTVRFLPETLVLHRLHGANTAGVVSALPGDVVRETLAARAETYRERARLGREYAAFAERLARERPDLAERLHRNAGSLRRASDRWDRRSELYGSGARVPARVRTLARLATAGGYRSRRYGGLGARSLAKDALVAAFGVGASRRLVAVLARLLLRS